MYDADPVLARFVETARKYWLLDNESLEHLRNMVLNTPIEARDILYDPAWLVGFVSGMIYAKRRAQGITVDRGEMQILADIVQKALAELEHMPYVGNRN